MIESLQPRHRLALTGQPERRLRTMVPWVGKACQFGKSPGRPGNPVGCRGGRVGVAAYPVAPMLLHFLLDYPIAMGLYSVFPSTGSLSGDMASQPSSMGQIRTGNRGTCRGRYVCGGLTMAFRKDGIGLSSLSGLRVAVRLVRRINREPIMDELGRGRRSQRSLAARPVRPM